MLGDAEVAEYLKNRKKEGLGRGGRGEKHRERQRTETQT